MDESEIRKDVVRRLNVARKCGVRYWELEDACPDHIGMITIIGMMNAQIYPIEVWEAVDESLKKLGY